MILQTTSDAELLFLPEWAAALLYFATIPLGLLVGYLAYRGFRRAGRREARVLALGLVLLTVVDTALGTTIGVGGTTVVDRASALIRSLVQLVGICCIIYAMYVPERVDAGPEGTAMDDYWLEREETSPDTDGRSLDEEDGSR